MYEREVKRELKRIHKDGTSSGHTTGGRRPVQTRKKSKDLSVCKTGSHNLHGDMNDRETGGFHSVGGFSHRCHVTCMSGSNPSSRPRLS